MSVLLYLQLAVQSAGVGAKQQSNARPHFSCCLATQREALACACPSRCLSTLSAKNNFLKARFLLQVLHKVVFNVIGVEG